MAWVIQIEEMGECLPSRAETNPDKSGKTGELSNRYRGFELMDKGEGKRTRSRRLL
jgi:hypothetical protein